MNASYIRAAREMLGIVFGACFVYFSFFYILLLTGFIVLNCSVLGIQEMGIPEAITHAIDQLPIGKRLKCLS